MPNVSQSGVFNLQEFTNLGALMANGRIYTYAAGTTNYKAAYTDSAGSVLHTYTADGTGLPDGQYIALNSRGEIPAPLHLLDDGPYDITLKTPSGATLWTRTTKSLRSTYTGSDGSNAIGYIAEGSGLTARTVQDKLREIHRSIVDQGASSSTLFDSTTAIQACIDYHIANRIYTMHVPTSRDGYYRITAPLVVSGRLKILGDGEFTTTIWADGFTSGQYILHFDNSDEDVIEECQVENITIRSNNGTPNGILIENVSHVTIKNVTLYNLNNGISVTGLRTFSLDFDSVYGVSTAGRTIRYFDFTGGGQHTFKHCTFDGLDGVFVEDTAVLDSMTFFNCNWEQCEETDFTCEGSIRGLNVYGGRSEGLQGTVSFNINPASGKYVAGYNHKGFFWSSDSGNAYPIGMGGNVEGFHISANHSVNIGFIAAVLLNGAGAAGVISGNNWDDSPLVVSANRPGVRVHSNTNSSGAMAEYGGMNGTFTATGTGFSGTAPSVTAKYSLADGCVAAITLPQISGTSNADTFTITGMPAAVRPAADVDLIGQARDNGGSFVPSLVRVKTTGVIEIYLGLAAANWTTSGTKTLYGDVLYYSVI